jgi:hypothetical protein
MNPAKRYAASQLTHVSADLLLLAIRALQTATTWNAKGLTAKEKTFLQETTKLMTRAQVRHTKINQRLEGSLNREYGWNGR